VQIGKYDNVQSDKQFIGVLAAVKKHGYYRLLNGGFWEAKDLGNSVFLIIVN
jgi:hypothetical protein